LKKLNKWNEETKNEIIKNGGSVQSLDIPVSVKNIFKIAWEISPRVLIDCARDRGAFICQSQSMNLFVEDVSKLSSIHMYGWKQGLKTGSYYIRTRQKTKSLQVTIEPQQICAIGCTSCGA
jgi:ribonucleotide reductase alpha subunit